jgi:hypothetical protein
MSILKGKPDAGQGGKRGHSNQDHWEFTEEIKEAAKKRRRHHAKKEIAEGLKEYSNKKTRTGVSLLTSDI